MAAKSQNKTAFEVCLWETGASVKNDKDMEKLNQMDTDGVNFHQNRRKKPKVFFEETKEKRS